MMLYFLISFFIQLCKSIDDINCDISKGPVIINSKTLKCDGSTTKTISSGQKVVITGKSTSNYISTSNSAATLYFKNLDINYDSAVSINGGNVKILFEGMNTIKSGDNSGIKCYNSAKITFSNGTQDDNHQSCKLKVTSDTYTGIGNDYEVSNCSELTFLGGQIEANGGIWGAGIGTGLGSSKYGGNVGTIKIVSGQITGNGGRYAAGIGCGRGQAAYSSNVGKIEIFGGIVSGTSQEYGAGIGAGFGNGDNSASVTSLYIYGGEVTAKGGKYGSGVGGGYGFGTNSASVSEISLKGSSKVENTKSDIIRCTSLIANGGDTSEKGVGNGKDGKATNVKTDTAALNCNNKYCDFKAESNCGRPWRCPSSGQSNCPQCANDYELISGLCVKIGSDGDGGDELPADGGEGCISSTPMGICLKCQPGYKLKEGKCYGCPSDDHCTEYKDECYCSKCESPYHLNEGFCTRCDVQFCSVINDDCTCRECVNGYIKESASICRSCGVSHCKYFVNGCECSICESGFFPENGHCSQCDADNCDVFVHQPNSCQCNLCAEGYKSYNGICQKVKDINYNIPSFVYCPNEKDFRCTEFTNDWSIRKDNLIDRIKSAIQNEEEPSNPNERSKYLAYKLFIDDIRNSKEPINAHQDINRQLKNLKTDKEKIIIYQFGSMKSYSYDFSKLRKKLDVVVINMDGIIYGSSAVISIKSGNLKKVRSLSLYLGEVNIQKGTLNVENIALIGSPIYNKATIQSDYFITDCYSLSVTINHVSFKVDNFAVFFPERIDWNLFKFTNNRQIQVQPGNQPSITVPTNIGKKQTAIVTYATDIILQSDSVKKFKDSLNISVHSYNDPIYIEFVGNEWKKTKLNENIVVESDDMNLVKVRGKPKSGKVKATQRFDETKNYPRKNKLSNGAIAGIVVAILILAAAAIWICVFFFFVLKPEENQTDRSMKSTNDLFKPVFQDDN